MIHSWCVLFENNWLKEIGQSCYEPLLKTNEIKFDLATHNNNF